MAEQGVSDLGFVISGEVDGHAAKIDVGLNGDEDIVLTTRVQQARSGPRRKDTEIRIPVQSLKKALRLLSPDNAGLLLPPQQGLSGIAGEAVGPGGPGYPMTPDELDAAQIGGVDVEDDFTPPGA